MFRLRRGAVAPPCSFAVRLGVAGIAVMLTGCASKQSSYEQARVAGPPPSQVTRVEIEDDGLPAQLAPRYRQPGRDDPTEPWSPNYGNGQRAPLPAVTPAEVLNQARRREMARVEPAPTPQPAYRAPAYQEPDAVPQRAPLPKVSPAEAFEQARRRVADKEAAARASAPPPARLTGIDEDALVRRAIAEHEMRRHD